MQTTRKTAWFNRLPELTAEVEELKREFGTRCEALGVSSQDILRDFWKQIMAQAVKESNWQEGIELDLHRTRELTDFAFEHLSEPAGPHVDFEQIITDHRQAVRDLKRKKVKVEEIAAYNLSAAHFALTQVLVEFQYRSVVRNIRRIEEVSKRAPDMRTEKTKTQLLELGHVAQELRDGFQRLKIPLGAKYTNDVSTVGDLMTRLEKAGSGQIANPMQISYLHFLHTLVLMGVIESPKLGRFRTKAVHVGNPNMMFPPPLVVPKLMEEFCRDFPHLVNMEDSILLAAKFSHRFVSIHPYSDGNGRMSRLIMNLLLLGAHNPPVYLKADKKGRHRYIWSLNKADRGIYEPLAALIATSLVSVYKQMLASLNP